MKVTIDFDDKDAWLLMSRAEATGKRLPDYVRDLLMVRAPSVQSQVKGLWSEGMCDADIATTLGAAWTVRAVSDLRRALGLRANRRYQASERVLRYNKGRAA